jgi:SAM-dependent methyltransferase
VSVPDADACALTELRDYFDETMYALVDLRLSMELPPSPTGFPPFDALSELVERLDPVHRLLFRLLRLGEVVNGSELDRLIGEPIISALQRAKLLVPTNAAGSWRTPNLLLVPAEGQLLLASIPESYPTASGTRDTWFDLSATVIARALPGWLSGARVIDVGSGTGMQALLCASRGASQVVGLDISERAVAVARTNAILNRQAASTDFRHSDMLAALEGNERFDYVVCNTPYAPVLEDARLPSTPADVGNSVVWRLLDALPPHLSRQARCVIGLWRSIGYRGSTYQLRALAARFGEYGYDVTAFVDTAPDSREGVLRILRSDLASRTDGSTDGDERMRIVEELLDRPDLPMDGFYNQIVFVRPRERGRASTPPPLFGVGIRSEASIPLRC